MKRIIMILTMLLVGINLYSQDFEPSQHKFYWSPTGNYIYLSADMDYFKQKDFLLGWHWGGKTSISQTSSNAFACDLRAEMQTSDTAQRQGAFSRMALGVRQ